MARKPDQSDIYEAIDSFSTAHNDDGYWFTVTKGQTFDGDHWLVKKHPHLFKLMQPRFAASPVEQATAAPGEKRGA